MNAIKKITLFIFSCLALTNITTECLFGPPGRGSGAATGALVGGLAGGRTGALTGLAVGGFTDMVGAAAADDAQRRAEAEYYDRMELERLREEERFRRAREMAE